MSTEHLNNGSPSSENTEISESMLSFVELNESDKKRTPPSPKKRFRRRTLTLILTSVGTVLVAVALLIVLLINPSVIPVKPNNPDDTTDGTTSTTAPEVPKITLLNKSGGESGKATPMKQIHIQNKDDSFSIRYDDATKLYRLDGYEDLYLDTELLVTLRAHTETIEAIDKVQNASNLAAFGLAQPQATATITYTDDSTSRLFVGDATPSNSGYYCQLEGTEGVYIFESDAVSLFCFRSIAFVRTVLVTPPDVKTDDKDGKALLKEVTFSGTAHPIPLVMRRSYYNDSEELTYFSYVITAPYTRCTNDDTSNKLSQLQGIAAEQALILHPSAEQKKKMGFTNPLMDLKLTMAVETEAESQDTTDTSNNSSVASKNDTPKKYYNSIDYHLVVGSLDEKGNYVVMVDGIDAIFLVSKETYGYFFDCTYQNAVNEYLFLKHIEYLSRISIKLNDRAYDFNLTHFPNKEDTNDQLVVTVDDKTLSTEEFRELYELLMGLKRYGVPEKVPSSQVPLELALYDNDGKLYLSAKYYNTTGSLCTVETSEGELFTTRWSDIDFFMQQVENYLDGKDVLLSS